MAFRSPRQLAKNVKTCTLSQCISLWPWNTSFLLEIFPSSQSLSLVSFSGIQSLQRSLEVSWNLLFGPTHELQCCLLVLGMCFKTLGKGNHKELVRLIHKALSSFFLRCGLVYERLLLVKYYDYSSALCDDIQLIFNIVFICTSCFRVPIYITFFTL